MKYTLTIEADSADKLREMLQDAAQKIYTAAGEFVRYDDTNNPATPHSEEGPFTGVLPTSTRVTLPTGDDPADVYGPGNGPVETMYRAVADVPAPAPTAPTVDANNMPHDERIHAGSKALNADGTWRKKRGVSDELIRSVEAAATPHDAPEPDRCGEPGLIYDGTDAFLAPLAPTPASIMSRIAALVTSGDKTPAYVQEIVKSCDLTDGIAQIASDSDALERVVAALQADGVL
jgi:hypothetical protein